MHIHNRCTSTCNSSLNLRCIFFVVFSHFYQQCNLCDRLEINRTNRPDICSYAEEYSMLSAMIGMLGFRTQCGPSIQLDAETKTSHDGHSNVNSGYLPIHSLNIQTPPQQYAFIPKLYIIYCEQILYERMKPKNICSKHMCRVHLLLSTDTDVNTQFHSQSV